MSLRLPDHWLWDFWFAVDGEDVHVFFLHAPASLGDPELRHRNARIGHAVSRDLRSWEPLPDPFGPGEPGAFDDLATWTGSVLHHDGRWYLYYTGISTQEDGAVQRIGVATSDDLLTWTKHGIVFEADGQWYETLGDGVDSEAWRDPWVVHDAESGRFHMVLTARANHGPPDGRGVIGHAVADDPLTWQALPPLSSPGEFSQLEVPQLVRIGGRWLIAFCTGTGDHSEARLARPGAVRESGTHYLEAAEPFGTYRVAEPPFLLGGPECPYYAGRFLRHNGQWHFFAWRGYGDSGEFVGELSDPMAVTVAPSGDIAVSPPMTPRLHNSAAPVL